MIYIAKAKEDLNIYQKLAKIRKMVGVIQRTKQGYGYKYVPEDEVLARISAGMERHKVSLIPIIKPGTFKIEPYKSVDKKGKDSYEIIVMGDMQFKWVNDENPDDCVVVDWALTGQQSDSSQAFGSGLTYCQRYFLLKYFQVATVDDDPDNWRSKKKEAEDAELEEALGKLRDEIISISSSKIKAGANKEEIYDIIAKNNNGKKNPNSIKDISIANEILSLIESFEVQPEKKAKSSTKENKEQEKKVESKKGGKTNE